MACSKLNTGQSSIDEDVKSLLVEQAKNLLQQIHEDIRINQNLSNQTKENYEAIAKRAEREYNAYLIMFLEETKILMNNARQKPVSERKPIQQAWQHALDVHVENCKKIAGPILHVLNVVTAEDKALQKKYRSYLAGGIIATVIAGSSLIAFVVYLYRGASCACVACSPTGAGCIFVGISLVAILAIGLFRKCINIAAVRKIYAKCSKDIKLCLVKAFPDLSNDSKRPITASKLKKVLQDTINLLKINDETWSHDEKLESLGRLADANLEVLRGKS